MPICEAVLVGNDSDVLALGLAQEETLAAAMPEDRNCPRYVRAWIVKLLDRDHGNCHGDGSHA